MPPIISKELLSFVLNENILEDGILLRNMICYSYISKSEQIKYTPKINIYELAHKCKEWAWSTGLQLTTFKGFNSKWYCEIPKGSDEETHRIAPKKMSFNSNTEPEAIFKACQSILDNRRN